MGKERWQGAKARPRLFSEWGKTMASALERARDYLTDVTPLRKDCGVRCGAACCTDDSADGGEEMGMLLFPGEIELYAPEDMSWMRIVLSEADFGAPVPLLVCDGTCPRDKRPLACRMFPLGPKVRGGGVVTARMDARARFVCPLYASGKRGLAPEFVEAAENAFSALWEDEEQRDFLIWLSGLIDEHVRMLREFRQP